MRSTLNRWTLRSLLPALALAFLAASSAQAQPFGTWAQYSGPGYIEVPDSAALNPTGGFTFEAWVAISNSTSAEDCRSIAGKDYTHAWWIGQCTIGGKPTLRTYLKGSASAKNGGEIPNGLWTHIAVTFDGSTRRHYINGELAASFPETGPLTTSGSTLRIGSDVSWLHTPTGSIDEVHLWNVARTLAQIRADLAAPITAPQPGLVAVWHLDNSTLDSIGGHNGTPTGVFSGSFAVEANCGASTVAALCLQNRFQVTTKWRTNPAPGTAPDGNGSVVVAGANSGIFWFFSSDNWEVMAKALNGCALNSRYWIYSAATTNVFYRMDVLDVRAGVQKIYFNYPGPPAPAVTDSSAFATCP